MGADVKMDYSYNRGALPIMNVTIEKKTTGFILACAFCIADNY